ncbi:pyridoxal phosphate-dependent aminotransferase [Clostridium aminobutyricum]|uniref:Aminotransferase n=1 Tax=Clostridium aminobutyricum TaxID=33953 RepID=A0A939D866_CLOAM|nr:pyridoxal phosphate-dependent aminotransferase [Clostridium aminobutyricum]MBN7773274.1 pyridoxal phosphate-dependent aminotransferase [Clostridium aminobutyricum]
MIAKSMESYVTGSSAIRAMFEEGAKLAKIYGAENVYDFSLGNPNLNPPEEIKQAILDVLNEEEPTFVHGYMNNAGYEDVRAKIAEHLNKKFSATLKADNILMTVGAAGGLNVIFKTLLDPGDEVIVFAPYFGEYRSYIANYSGKLVTIPPNTETFQPNLETLKGSITQKTKAVLINSPNNPTGVVYSEATLKELAAILTEKEKEFGIDIYLVADEPYRELVYDGAEVPYVPHYFKNTIIGYSYSKSLSLPGDRIGYLVVPEEVADFENLMVAASTANRIMGFVNAPSLMQRMVARCLDCSVDIEIYNRNREALYNGLTDFGYECIKPEGSFYLFVKAPIEDDVAFCRVAKDYRILIVPGSAFGCPGYVRIVYCVAYDTIIHALPQFKKLIEDIKNK